MEAMGAANVDALFPLTPTQEGMLYHTLLAEEAGMYVMQFSCDLEGDLDVGAFRQAWDSAISRHQVLRSLVIWESRDTPLQLIRKRVEAPWTVRDLTDLTAEQREQSLSRYLAEDARTPFVLDRAPLMRFALFRTADRSSRFVWTHHHVILDGWSLNIVLEEVLRDYELIRSREQPARAPGPSFQAFVNYLQAKDRSSARSFWKSYLNGFNEANRIDTTGWSGSPQWSASQDQIDAELDARTTHRLVEFARRNDLTLDTISRAAWATVVSRYSGQDDVVFGGVVSGRPPDLGESLTTVGPFINTLPVRTRVDPNRRLLDWLDDLRADRLRVAEYEWAPLPEIQEWSKFPAGTPLFTSLLVTENQPGADQIGHLKLTGVSYRQPSNYPLALFNFPGDNLRFILLHDPDVVDRVSARRLIANYVTVLESMAESPDARVGELAFFTEDDLREMIEIGRGDTLHPRYDTVIERISVIAADRPDAVAVTGDHTDLTYRTLLERARNLSARLVEANLEPGDTVAVAMERCPGMIVAILGVLMAGGAYVPLDPEAPSTRIRSQLSATKADVMIVLDEEDRPLVDSADTIEIRADGTCVQSPGNSRPGTIRPHPESPAYVMFTSGSTGEPKGVVVSHRALAQSTEARVKAYERQPSSYLLLSPFFFDSSVAGIFWALTTGAALVLPAPRAEQDVSNIERLIVRHSVSHLLTLPSLYGLLLQTSSTESLSTLRTAIVAGEACPPELVDLHHVRLPDTDLVNEYGPTEATVWATYHHTTPADGRSQRVPIGRPIPGVSAFILDADDQLAPPGVPGELVIAGSALADGYMSQPEQTSERFVEIELPLIDKVRVYRTGDRARINGNGLIDLLGRMDRQVKVRGRRIEPEEIEVVLASHDHVHNAVVELVAGTSGSKELAAFYVQEEGADLHPRALEMYLSDRLPSYMVPQHLLALDALPLNQNGKVDRSRLVVPRDSAHSEKSSRSMTESESLVVGIARDLIGHPAIGPDDNFFEAGGHSLLSMHLIARIRSETGAKISPNLVLFNSLAYAAKSIDEQLGRTSAEPTRPETEQTTRDDHVVWFGHDNGLFGILHRSVDQSESVGERVVVFCPPYGWEYYKTHRAMRGLARSVWDRYPVFRFDYRGTGDSADPADDVGLASWIEDTRDAVAQARHLTGAERVTMLGLRLGAGIAAFAAKDIDGCDHLVLWDPVVDGSRHLRGLEEMHRALFKQTNPRVARRDSRNELLGSPYPDSLRSELNSLRLAPEDMPSGAQVDLIVSARREDYEALTVDPGPLLSFEVVPDAGGWDDLGTFNSALLPGPIARRIASILKGSR